MLHFELILWMLLWQHLHGLITRLLSVEETVLNLMEKNLFVNVPAIKQKYHLENIMTYAGAEDNNKLLLHKGIAVASPMPGESDAYKTLTESYTYANKELGIGRVRGRDKADQWKTHRSRGFILPEDHPRHNAQKCVSVTRQAGEKPVSLYQDWKVVHEPFYMYKLENGIIDHTGMVALEFGYVQFLSHCETISPKKGKDFHASVTSSLRQLKESFGDRRAEFGWETLFTNQKFSRKQISHLESLKEPVYQRVLVISSIWDYNYHHFIHDCIARLIRWLPFLLENRDIYIHVREFEKKSNKMKKITKGMPLREKIVQLLGLNPSRIIARSIRARDIYLPREIGCNYALKHALEMRLLANVFLRRALEYSDGKCTSLLRPHEKNIIVMERDCHPFLRIWRCLNGSDFPVVRREILRRFPAFKVYSTEQFYHKKGGNMTLSLACDILEYMKATMIIGKHGAGFTNMMFMKPGGLVIELVGEFDGRMLPVCGYHGPLASLFGLHHYINYYDFFSGEDVNISQVVDQSAYFVSFLNYSIY